MKKPNNSTLKKSTAPKPAATPARMTAVKATPAKAAAKPAVAIAAPKAAPKAPAKAPAAPAPAPRREITSESIAARAYQLWDQQGRPQGRDLELWLKAEQQLKSA